MGCSVYRKARSPFWWMRVTVGELKIEKSTKLKDKGKAHTLAEQVHAQLETRWVNMQLGLPDSNDDPNMVLSQALDWVNRNRWANNKDGGKSARQVKRCIKLLGDIPVRAVNADATAMLRKKLEAWPKGVGDDGQIEYLTSTTVDRYMRAMSTLMKTLKERSSAYHDLTVPYFPIHNKPNARERILTDEEEMVLFGLMKKRDPDYHDLFVVLLDTGMRVGEGLTITYPNHIAKDCDQIRLHSRDTKNGKPRTLPVPERSQTILKRRKKQFPWMPFPHEVVKSGTRVSQKFGWYRNVMGIDDKDFVPHMLRHTCCTRLLEAGVPFDRVQAWMGHSTAEMTRRYGHLTSASLEGAADTINERNKRNSDAYAAKQRTQFSVVANG